MSPFPTPFTVKKSSDPGGRVGATTIHEITTQLQCHMHALVPPFGKEMSPSLICESPPFWNYEKMAGN